MHELQTLYFILCKNNCKAKILGSYYERHTFFYCHTCLFNSAGIIKCSVTALAFNFQRLREIVVLNGEMEKR